MIKKKEYLENSRDTEKTKVNWTGKQVKRENTAANVK